MESKETKSIEKNVKETKDIEVEKVIVTCDLLNVRSAGRKADNIVKTVTKNTILDVVKKGKTWTETTQGFVMTKFVEEK